MRCYLYILINGKGKHYVGITKLKPNVRLAKHNRGEVYSTKFGIPWSIIYTEEHSDYKSARIREKQVKSWKGGNAFKKLIARAAGSSNGRIEDSESSYLGSNPSPAALAMRKFGGVNRTTDSPPLAE